MSQQQENTPWHTRREFGQGAGLAVVEGVARVFGRRAVHAFLVPVAAYFLLARRVERHASRDFLSRVLGRPARLRDSLRHFHTFARVTVDRVFLLAPRGHHIPMRITGQEGIEATLREGRGCILLSAHFGSFEAARQSGLANPALRLRVLLDRAVNRRLIEQLERISPQFAAGIIDAAGEPRAMTLRIGECLRAGEWVGWLADRSRGGERTVAVDFLGSLARLPASPFIIAQLFRVPVYLVLAAIDGRGYEIFVEQLVDDAALDARDRDAFVRERVTFFAERLAHHVRRSPYNWFNFYDIWNA